MTAEVALAPPHRHLGAVAIPQIRLKVRARGRQPWFYRKMVQKPAQPLPAGSVVTVVDRDGHRVGSGFYNPRNELALRLFTADFVGDPVAHFRHAIARANALREQLGIPEVTNAYRIVHAEGDGFPGLVLDRLATTFVAQVQSLGMLQQLEAVGEWLLEQWPQGHLVLLQDRDAEQREGLERLQPPAPRRDTVHEHGIRFGVEAGGGHKTGFFADQRDNRQLVRSLARGRRVLDLCCNSGGFALNAAAGAAHSVRAVDLDEQMVAVTRSNARANGLRLQVEHADAFDVLRELRPGEFDLIVLDPPKWVHGRHEIESGLARYRDLNRLAFEKSRKGGLIVTCSCSGAISEDTFLRTLREAAGDVGLGIRVLALRGAGADHPVALECPETRYLKVACLEVRD